MVEVSIVNIAKGGLFSTGDVVMTRGISFALIDNPNGFGGFTSRCLMRHISGDWGDLDNHDRTMNDNAIKGGDRILSSYKIPSSLISEAVADDKLWIITENDRSVTTLLFPSEY